ncbi:MAG: hypothetical protein ACI8X5_003453, partial [Planctomycetota bacterium]
LRSKQPLEAQAGIRVRPSRQLFLRRLLRRLERLQTLARPRRQELRRLLRRLASRSRLEETLRPILPSPRPRLILLKATEPKNSPRVLTPRKLQISVALQLQPIKTNQPAVHAAWRKAPEPKSVGLRSMRGRSPTNLPDPSGCRFLLNLDDQFPGAV